MRFSRPRPTFGEINLTPLIDVVFQLLVFFMLAGSMRASDAFPVDIAVSKSRTFGDVSEAVVLIGADGQVALNDQRMSKPELLNKVAGLLRERPDILVQVKADADAEARAAIGVMEELRDAGVGYIVLLTRGAGLEEGK